MPSATAYRYRSATVSRVGEMRVRCRTNTYIRSVFQVRRQMAQQVGEVVGVLLLFRLDFLHQAPRRCIERSEVGGDLAIAVDRDPLGDQVLLDHVDQVLAFDVFRMA